MKTVLTVALAIICAGCGNNLAGPAGTPVLRPPSALTALSLDSAHVVVAWTAPSDAADTTFQGYVFSWGTTVDTLPRAAVQFTAGPLPPNPPALLARKSLGQLLDELRGEFDWVLIDSPPLASVTDALLLARHADHAVLVIQHNKVDKRLVKRAVAALRKATPNLLGAVLNVVDVRARSYNYYYYAQREGARPRRTTPPSGEGPDGTPAAPAGV